MVSRTGTRLGSTRIGERSSVPSSGLSRTRSPVGFSERSLTANGSVPALVAAPAVQAISYEPVAAGMRGAS